MQLREQAGNICRLDAIARPQPKIEYRERLARLERRILDMKAEQDASKAARIESTRPPSSSTKSITRSRRSGSSSKRLRSGGVVFGSCFIPLISTCDPSACLVEALGEGGDPYRSFLTVRIGIVGPWTRRLFQ